MWCGVGEPVVRGCQPAILIMVRSWVLVFMMLQLEDVTIHFPKSLFPLSYLISTWSYQITFPSHLVSSPDASNASSSFPPHVSHMPYICFPMHPSHSSHINSMLHTCTVHFLYYFTCSLHSHFILLILLTCSYLMVSSIYTLVTYLCTLVYSLFDSHPLKTLSSTQRALPSART